MPKKVNEKGGEREGKNLNFLLKLNRKFTFVFYEKRKKKL